MLCILSLGVSGVAAAQSEVAVFSHHMRGDRQLPDGGWVMQCAEANGPCIGHISGEPAPDNDSFPIHHHHSSGESTQGLLPERAGGAIRHLISGTVRLYPEPAAPLSDLRPAIPHQPPRA